MDDSENIAPADFSLAGAREPSVRATSGITEPDQSAAMTTSAYELSRSGVRTPTSEHKTNPDGSPGAGTDRDDTVVARAGTVGIIAATYQERYSHDTPILHSVELALAECGMKTSSHNRARNLDEPLQDLKTAVDGLREDDVDAIILVCLDMDSALVEDIFLNCDVGVLPVVCILSGELHLPIPHVFYDNRIGGYQAAKHLMDAGHDEIAVFAPTSASWVTERLAGINHAVTHARQTPVDVRLFTSPGLVWSYLEDSATVGYNAARDAIAAGWVPSGGVICINDLVAYGVARAAEESGAKAGRDFALIGFDDDPRSAALGLTTMRPPLEAMGREASRMLMDELSGSHVSHQVRLRAHLITRLSTNLTVRP